MSRFLCVNWHMLTTNGTMIMCRWWIVDTLSYNAIIPLCVSDICLLETKAFGLLEVGSGRVTWRTEWQAGLLSELTKLPKARFQWLLVAQRHPAWMRKRRDEQISVHWLAYADNQRYHDNVWMMNCWYPLI
jgi:hypothetical protein